MKASCLPDQRRAQLFIIQLLQGRTASPNAPTVLAIELKIETIGTLHCSSGKQ